MQFHAKIVFIFFFIYTLIYSSPYEVFVSPAGNNSNLGTETSPLKTLNCARDKAVTNKTSEGMIITLLGGVYQIDSAFTLTSKHSGSKNAPFIIRGKKGDTAILTGGVELKYENSKLCDKSDIAAGIDPAYAPKIRKWFFSDLGITDTGFWSMENIKNGKIPRHYRNDSLMQLAKWPDTGYAIIDSVLVTKPIISNGKITGDSIGKFIIETDSLKNVKKEIQHVFMYGYWFWDWYANYALIESIDTLKHIVKATYPNNSPYGYKTGQRFYIENLLFQINKEGKWAVDPLKRLVYFWPPENINKTNSIITVNNIGLISLNNSSYIKFQNLAIENTINNAVQITACTSCVISKSIIRGIGGYGIILKNSAKNRIDNCVLYNIGRSPILISGGNRTNLVSSDILIANNTIHDFGQISKSSQPGVIIDSSSIGCKVINNTFFNSPGAAVMFMGNNHCIVNNYIYSVCKEVQDDGTIYTGRDWTSRGTHIVNNYIENSGANDVNAIYLDDMACGIKIYNNIIKNIPRGILIGGGRDNYFGKNIVINATQWIVADSRGLGWAKYFVDAGGTCPTRLASVPCSDSIWACTYPALLTILKDIPGCPKGNVVKGNRLVNCGKPSISPENIQYGIFDSNSTLASFSANPQSKYCGVQEGLNVDTISPVPLLRMPVIPLVRNVFSKSDTIFIVSVPSYHSANLKARVVNLLSGEECFGSGGDTVKIPGPSADPYSYSLWYSDIPYQDSTFAAHEAGYVGVLQKEFTLGNVSAKPALSVMHNGLHSSKIILRYVIPNNLEVNGSLVTNAVDTKVNIFDMRGKMVATLVNCPKTPGSYAAIWDGKCKSGARIASCTYIASFFINNAMVKSVQFLKVN
jgi:hypothetical protein